MTWMDRYPLTQRLEQAWEGCGWIEDMEDFHGEPLLPTPTLETLAEWKRGALRRQKRIWAKAERYFEQHPKEHERLMNLSQTYKDMDQLKYV